MEERVNPKTKESYYTPHFSKDVTHPHNKALIKAVAQFVWDDLQVVTGAIYF
jgi:hypothetical protein